MVKMAADDFPCHPAEAQVVVEAVLCGPYHFAVHPALAVSWDQHRQKHK